MKKGILLSMLVFALSSMELVAEAIAYTYAPRRGWTLASVDSEETSSEDAGAIHAFDGTPSTYWHTRWTGSAPAGPHQITIQLNSEILVAGFVLEPRVSGENGDIKGYEFYTSLDGRAFDLASRGELPRGKQKKTVRLDQIKRARFVRLVAVSEVNGGPWASLAELSLIAAMDPQVYASFKKEVRGSVVLSSGPASRPLAVRIRVQSNTNTYYAETNLPAGKRSAPFTVRIPDGPVSLGYEMTDEHFVRRGCFDGKGTSYFQCPDYAFADLGKEDISLTVPPIERFYDLPGSIFEKRFEHRYRVSESLILKKNTFDLAGPARHEFEVVWPLPYTNEFFEISNLKFSPGSVEQNPGELSLRMVSVLQKPSPKFTVGYDVSLHELFPLWDRITKLYDYNRSDEMYELFTVRREGRIDADHPTIARTALRLRSESKDLLDYVRRAYMWEQQTLKWKPTAGEISEILSNGGGECSSLSTVLVSLLRNQGIPARTVWGFVIRKGGESHVWTEFYLEGYGWLPADPAFFGGGDKPAYYGYFDGRRMFRTRSNEPGARFWHHGSGTGDYEYDADVQYQTLVDPEKEKSAFFNHPDHVAAVRQTAILRINEHRKSKGLKPLTPSTRLDRIGAEYFADDQTDHFKSSGLRLGSWGIWSLRGRFGEKIPLQAFADDIPYSRLENPDANFLGVAYEYKDSMHRFYFLPVQSSEELGDSLFNAQ